MDGSAPATVFHGPVVMSQARIKGAANFSSSRFMDDVNFTAIRIDGNLYLAGSVFAKKLDLGDAQIGQHLVAFPDASIAAIEGRTEAGDAGPAATGGKTVFRADPRAARTKPLVGQTRFQGPLSLISMRVGGGVNRRKPSSRMRTSRQPT